MGPFERGDVDLQASAQQIGHGGGHRRV